MKTKIASLILLLCAAGCAGVAAREEALIPVMQIAWTNMQDELDAGAALQPVEAQPAIAAARESMTQALESGDRFQVAAQDWAALSTVAIQGINAQLAANQIGPTVAASLLERIANFNEAFILLIR